LGISGGIAAFKAAEIVRLLRGEGHEVRCALTRSATAFVSPLTLEVLSGHGVYQEEYLSPNQGGVELHIETAQWAEVLCIAPATAHVIGRLALGLADDFLTTTALAFAGPVVVVPAMHSEMWAKPAVRRNTELLAERGCAVLGPVVGHLASGEIGIGRMAEPAEVVGAIRRALSPGLLSGKTVLVSAGPTREAADPVRYLSNRSSGKMGFALAAEAAAQGARTVLVAGPVERPTPPGVERIDVVTALEMGDQMRRLAAAADLVIMAAAVCDFRPREVSSEKLKKNAGLESLQLAPNPDILSDLADAAPHAVRVGFAAETGELAGEARRKLLEKRADFIVANDVSRAGIGFESDQNEVTVYRREGSELFLGRRPKRELAVDLIRLLSASLNRVESERATVDR
jgi:phosphopantothenoylcysteine decarboxylase / phosphopantothenate---cysteine ligase